MTVKIWHLVAASALLSAAFLPLGFVFVAVALVAAPLLTTAIAWVLLHRPAPAPERAAPQRTGEEPYMLPTLMHGVKFPAGTAFCSRGCHVLVRAKFDPHDGTPVAVAAAV